MRGWTNLDFIPFTAPFSPVSKIALVNGCVWVRFQWVRFQRPGCKLRRRGSSGSGGKKLEVVEWPVNGEPRGLAREQEYIDGGKKVSAEQAVRVFELQKKA